MLRIPFYLAVIYEMRISQLNFKFILLRLCCLQYTKWLKTDAEIGHTSAVAEGTTLVCPISFLKWQQRIATAQNQNSSKTNIQ